MALQQIEPQYLSWVRAGETKGVDSLISSLQTEVENLNKTILDNSSSDNEIRNTFNDARQKLLYTQLVFNNQKLIDPDKDYSSEEKKLNILHQNINTIEFYEQNNILSKQKKSIDTITWITMIFIPLTLIVGYYGMNFHSMGAPATSTAEGPFNFKYGQLWVLLLFVISIILTVGFLKIFFN
jgi:magnesium transporter